MIRITLEPGRALGPFVLGTPVGRVARLLLRVFGKPCERLRSCYAGTWLVIQMAVASEIGNVRFSFSFSKESQLLTMIVVEAMPAGPGNGTERSTNFDNGVLVHLQHRQGPLFDSFAALQGAFGAFAPGELVDTNDISQSVCLNLEEFGSDALERFCSVESLYRVAFSGVVVDFGISPRGTEAQKRDDDSRATAMQRVNHLARSGRLPEDAAPTPLRFVVFDGSDAFARRAIPAAVCPDLPFYMEQVRVKFDSTRSFVLYFDKRDRRLFCGSTVQDVIAVLGSPGAVFKDSVRLPSLDAGYIFNYFDLGIDIKFDAKTHVVTKFVLHANTAGHVDFATYHRANFLIEHSSGARIHSCSNMDDVCTALANMSLDDAENVRSRALSCRPAGAQLDSLLVGVDAGIVVELLERSSCVAKVNLFES